MASNGAKCPAQFRNDDNAVPVTSGWNQARQYFSVFDNNYTKIPEFPAESYIDVTVTLTPKKMVIIDENSTCSDARIDATIAIDNLSI